MLPAEAFDLVRLKRSMPIAHFFMRRLQEPITAIYAIWIANTLMARALNL